MIAASQQHFSRSSLALQLACTSICITRAIIIMALYASVIRIFWLYIHPLVPTWSDKWLPVALVSGSYVISPSQGILHTTDWVYLLLVGSHWTDKSQTSVTIHVARYAVQTSNLQMIWSIFWLSRGLAWAQQIRTKSQKYSHLWTLEMLLPYLHQLRVLVLKRASDVR